MPYRHWTLEDIPWSAFDPALVNPDQLKIAKAAAMVEYNASDYVAYLENVFADDPGFVAAAQGWGEEEVQHGAALGTWAQLADPEFDFAERFARFREGFRPDVTATSSIRGSRAGELVARCMVEVGTSSYYTALGEAADDPVLKAICRHIAADEFRHYKLFYDHLKRYIDREGLNKLQRLRVALGRIAETEDDELSYAYYAANTRGEPYDREACNRAYLRRAIPYYKDPIVDRGLAMIFKAVGLRPHSPLYTAASAGAKWIMHQRQRKLARLAAA
jgi:hypothetical protein